MLAPGGSIEEFANSIKKNCSQISRCFYKREVKFFTANEEKQISDAFAAADTKDELIQLSTILVGSVQIAI